MRKYKQEPKAHEVTTVYTMNGVCQKFMGKYIVIALSASDAISPFPIIEGEEVLRAREMSEYKVIMVKK